MRVLSLTFISVLSFVLMACTDTENQAPPPTEAPPPEIDVALPLQHKLTDWDEFTGRFEAIDNVELRARVTGYLVEKKFKDGQSVKKGDVLYIIEPRPFEYELKRIKAQHELAKKELERAHVLRESRAISEEEVDRRFQELKITEAAVDNAQLQLSFTRIVSPINGKISDSFVDVGNLVQENQTLLTRVVSTNPIHFRFEGSQGDLLKYIRLDRAGQRPSSDRSPNPIYVKLLDEDKFYHEGKMHFVDNAVDTGTGTIEATATVNNDEGIIYPGLFGRARLVGRTNYDAILVPENAINTDQDKKFVYVVDKDNKVKRNYISVGNLLDNNFIVVTSGLNEDEQVVINGIQRIRSSGQEVTTKLVALEWKALEMLGSSDSNQPQTAQ